MDFGYKKENDMNIVKEFMAKIGAKNQLSVYQRDRIGINRRLAIR